MARFTLGGDGPSNLTRLPSIISQAAEGQLSADLARWILEDPTYCAGYRPLCTGQNGFSIGVYLTTLCAEQLPYVNQTALSAAIAGDPTYQAVFGDSPYREGCAAWGVPPAAAPQPIASTAPILLLSGRFDSYSPYQRTASVAADLPSAWALEDPASTHHVLGFSTCYITLRNMWTWAPTTPPDATTCRSAKPVQMH